METMAIVKDYPTWELGGIIKKAEVISYILAVMKDDLPVTGMELVRQAKSLNWTISVTHVYNLLKNLEKHAPKQERFPILTSKWLDDGCRERLYYLQPVTGANYTRHAIETMSERIEQVQRLIRTVEAFLKSDSTISPSVISDSSHLLSVRDLYRLAILSYTNPQMPIREQIKQDPFGLRTNKAHYRLQADWLSQHGYLDTDSVAVTNEGLLFLHSLKEQLIAQIPFAKQRISELIDYPKSYQRMKASRNQT
ncbi:hypothetical protein [Brevibacillus reuszeri]|uniref:hypothetical protein n=1 Tax=Brevibacillus reuszeri TaxID=54915 RepID=UPI003D1B1544